MLAGVPKPKAAKKEKPVDPDKLVRERPGAYRTGDGRFTVQSDAGGAWFVVDAEQIDELGMPRVLGPHGTLAEARQAVADARSAPPMASLLKARAAKAGGEDARARAATRARERAEARAAREREDGDRERDAAKPRPPRIRYATSVEGVEEKQLSGFWQEWPDPPSPRTHLRALKAADEVVLAIDADTRSVVGYVTAFTDRVFSAYVPLLEVVPDYRRKGIGSELVRRMLARLGDLEMIDLNAKPELRAFFERFGLEPSTAMTRRRARGGT